MSQADSRKVSETTLWEWLNTVKYKLKKALHMCRLENAVGVGASDVEGCFNGVQFWCELKCEARPVRPSTVIKPRFEKTQNPWHRRRREAGGRTYVLLQVGAGAKADRLLFHGKDIPYLTEGDTLDKLKERAIAPSNSSALDLVKLMSSA